jgi:flagellar basal-body rod protein FlgC
MDLFTAMDISASGLTAQRTRMNVISSNIANAQTTRTNEGGPYKRKDVIFKENSFENQLAAVEVDGIVEDPAPGKQMYDPGNPDANADGYVTMPNVNMMEEMVNMIGATRAFEANTVAVKSQKEMALKSLSIGR